MKLEARVLIGSIILHHIYIAFLNTSSVHGIPVPDKLIWTALLTVFIVGLIYFYLKQPAETWYEKSLYAAIMLSLGASILRTFGYSIALISYSLILIFVVILSTVPLLIHHHFQIRLALLSIYTLEFIILLSRTLQIRNVIQVIGPILELAIVIGIIYYNYSLGFRFDELFIIIIVTYIGWQLGLFIADLSSQVPKLIVATMFEQTLSVGQYEIASNIIVNIDHTFFLSLHIAEVFNLIIVQILSKRSVRAAAIILTGLDMSYPPIMAFRAIAILAFLRDSLNNKSKSPDIEGSDKVIDQNAIEETIPESSEL